MNIDEFNIGIEIEYAEGQTQTVAERIALSGVDCELVPYGRCHANHSGWIVTTDQTVSRNICYSTGRGLGGEVVSPKLKYRDALEQVKKVCDAMNSIDDVSMNRNCGLHISVSWPNMNAQQIRKLLDRYKKYERDIDAFMPPSRRGNRNRWCGSLDASWVSRVVNGRGDRLSQVREGGRYVKLNLMNLDGSSRSRVEFRHHSGTTDPRKIANWIKFVCRMIKSAQINDSLQATYASEKRTWFADIREQLAAVGITTKWSRALAEDGANGMTFHSPHGMLLASRTYEQMEAFYSYGANNKGRNARLTDEFMEFAKCLMQQCGLQMDVDRGVYHGLDTDAIEYFRNRVEHFNARGE